MQEQFTLWEEWRPVPVSGYEAHYEVSNLGRVRRSSRARRTQPGNLLKPRNTRLGYLMVAIYNADHERTDRSVHSLVASAFLNSCRPGYEVNHKDGNKANNALANLEYTTRSGNMQHAVSTGLKRGLPGERNPYATLTEEAVRQIREAEGRQSSRELAARYGVTMKTIRWVQTRKTWAHVT
jgi:hypothetical protein